MKNVSINFCSIGIVHPWKKMRDRDTQRETDTKEETKKKKEEKRLGKKEGKINSLFAHFTKPLGWLTSQK